MPPSPIIISLFSYEKLLPITSNIVICLAKEESQIKLTHFVFVLLHMFTIGLLSSEIDIIIKKEHLHNIKRNNRRLVSQVYITDSL